MVAVAGGVGFAHIVDRMVGVPRPTTGEEELRSLIADC
jgi:hypothetical protein